jgi:hypothetical protein
MRSRTRYLIQATLLYHGYTVTPLVARFTSELRLIITQNGRPTRLQRTYYVLWLGL